MEPREAIEAVFAGWERADAEAVARLFAPAGRYEDPLFPEVLVGREQIAAGVAAAMAEITECEIPVRALACAGGVGLVEAEFRCRLGSRGDRFDFPFAMVVETGDGGIERLTEYFDTRPLSP